MKCLKCLASFRILVLLAVLVIVVTDHKSTVKNITVAQPQVVMVDLTGSDEATIRLWQTEISRRFNNALGVVVHGNRWYEGEWCCFAPTEPIRAADLVRTYQKQFPDRTIVLISCNPCHYKLGVPGVYYASGSVWVIPDRAITSLSDLMAQDKMFDDAPFDITAIMAQLPKPTLRPRWVVQPEAVGNIFEFTCE